MVPVLTLQTRVSDYLSGSRVFMNVSLGINEYGYLRVRRQDNSEHCLQPDGNRFDMMHNMIVIRRGIGSIAINFW